MIHTPNYQISKEPPSEPTTIAYLDAILDAEHTLGHLQRGRAFTHDYSRLGAPQNIREQASRSIKRLSELGILTETTIIFKESNTAGITNDSTSLIAAASANAWSGDKLLSSEAILNLFSSLEDVSDDKLLHILEGHISHLNLTSSLQVASLLERKGSPHMPYVTDALELLCQVLASKRGYSHISQTFGKGHIKDRTQRLRALSESLEKLQSEYYADPDDSSTRLKPWSSVIISTNVMDNAPPTTSTARTVLESLYSLSSIISTSREKHFSAHNKTLSKNGTGNGTQSDINQTTTSFEASDGNVTLPYTGNTPFSSELNILLNLLRNSPDPADADCARDLFALCLYLQRQAGMTLIKKLRTSMNDFASRSNAAADEPSSTASPTPSGNSSSVSIEALDRLVSNSIVEVAESVSSVFFPIEVYDAMIRASALRRDLDTLKNVLAHYDLSLRTRVLLASLAAKLDPRQGEVEVKSTSTATHTQVNSSSRGYPFVDVSSLIGTRTATMSGPMETEPAHALSAVESPDGAKALALLRIQSSFCNNPLVIDQRAMDMNTQTAIPLLPQSLALSPAALTIATSAFASSQEWDSVEDTWMLHEKIAALTHPTNRGSVMSAYKRLHKQRGTNGLNENEVSSTPSHAKENDLAQAIGIPLFESEVLFANRVADILSRSQQQNVIIPVTKSALSPNVERLINKRSAKTIDSVTNGSLHAFSAPTLESNTSSAPSSAAQHFDPSSFSPSSSLAHGSGSGMTSKEPPKSTANTKDPISALPALFQLAGNTFLDPEILPLWTALYPGSRLQSVEFRHPGASASVALEAGVIENMSPSAPPLKTIVSTSVPTSPRNNASVADSLQGIVHDTVLNTSAGFLGSALRRTIARNSLEGLAPFPQATNPLLLDQMFLALSHKNEPETIMARWERYGQLARSSFFEQSNILDDAHAKFLRDLNQKPLIALPSSIGQSLIHQKVSEQSTNRPSVSRKSNINQSVEVSSPLGLYHPPSKTTFSPHEVEALVYPERTQVLLPPVGHALQVALENGINFLNRESKQSGGAGKSSTIIYNLVQDILASPSTMKHNPVMLQTIAKQLAQLMSQADTSSQPITAHSHESRTFSTADASDIQSRSEFDFTPIHQARELCNNLVAQCPKQIPQSLADCLGSVIIAAHSQVLLPRYRASLSSLSPTQLGNLGFPVRNATNAQDQSVFQAQAATVHPASQYTTQPSLQLTPFEGEVPSEEGILFRPEMNTVNGETFSSLNQLGKQTKNKAFLQTSDTPFNLPSNVSTVVPFYPSELPAYFDLNQVQQLQQSIQRRVSATSEDSLQSPSGSFASQKSGRPQKPVRSSSTASAASYPRDLQPRTQKLDGNSIVCPREFFYRTAAQAAMNILNVITPEVSEKLLRLSPCDPAASELIQKCVKEHLQDVSVVDMCERLATSLGYFYHVTNAPSSNPKLTDSHPDIVTIRAYQTFLHTVAFFSQKIVSETNSNILVTQLEINVRNTLSYLLRSILRNGHLPYTLSLPGSVAGGHSEPYYQSLLHTLLHSLSRESFGPLILPESHQNTASMSHYPSSTLNLNADASVSDLVHTAATLLAALSNYSVVSGMRGTNGTRQSMDPIVEGSLCASTEGDWDLVPRSLFPEVVFSEFYNASKYYEPAKVTSHHKAIWADSEIAQSTIAEVLTSMLNARHGLYIHAVQALQKSRESVSIQSQPSEQTKRSHLDTLVTLRDIFNDTKSNSAKSHDRAQNARDISQNKVTLTDEMEGASKQLEKEMVSDLIAALNSPTLPGSAFALEHPLATSPSAISSLLSHFIKEKRHWETVRVLSGISLSGTRAADATATLPATNTPLSSAQLITSAPFFIHPYLVSRAVTASKTTKLSEASISQDPDFIVGRLTHWIRSITQGSSVSRNPANSSIQWTRYLPPTQAQTNPRAKSTTYASINPVSLLTGNSLTRILPTLTLPSLPLLDVIRPHTTSSSPMSNLERTEQSLSPFSAENVSSTLQHIRNCILDPVDNTNKISPFGDPILHLPIPTRDSTGVSIAKDKLPRIDTPQSLIQVHPTWITQFLQSCTQSPNSPLFPMLVRELFRHGGWLSPSAAQLVAKYASENHSYFLPLLLHLQAQSIVLLQQVPRLNIQKLLPHLPITGSGVDREGYSHLLDTAAEAGALRIGMQLLEQAHVGYRLPSDIALKYVHLAKSVGEEILSEQLRNSFLNQNIPMYETRMRDTFPTRDNTAIRRSNSTFPGQVINKNPKHSHQYSAPEPSAASQTLKHTRNANVSSDEIAASPSASTRSKAWNSQTLSKGPSWVSNRHQKSSSNVTVDTKGASARLSISESDPVDTVLSRVAEKLASSVASTSQK